jgi:hypothetical protein
MLESWNIVLPIEQYEYEYMDAIQRGYTRWM